MAFHSPFPFGIFPYRHLQHHKSVMFLCILYRAFCSSLIRVSSRLVSNPCSRVPFAWTTRSSLIRMCSSLHTLTLSATRVHVERCRGHIRGSIQLCLLSNASCGHPATAIYYFRYVFLSGTTRSFTCSLLGPHACSTLHSLVRMCSSLHSLTLSATLPSVLFLAPLTPLVM